MPRTCPPVEKGAWSFEPAPPPTCPGSGLKSEGGSCPKCQFSPDGIGSIVPDHHEGASIGNAQFWADFDAGMVTLADYLRRLRASGDRWAAASPGRAALALTEDLEHWRRLGITTASRLGQYLDDCAERELRKS